MKSPKPPLFLAFPSFPQSLAFGGSGIGEERPQIVNDKGWLVDADFCSNPVGPPNTRLSCPTPSPQFSHPPSKVCFFSIFPLLIIKDSSSPLARGGRR